eukprot:11210177-Lingulodinium_polyedra.AAC.1
MMRLNARFGAPTRRNAARSRAPCWHHVRCEHGAWERAALRRAGASNRALDRNIVQLSKQNSCTMMRSNA